MVGGAVPARRRLHHHHVPETEAGVEGAAAAHPDQGAGSGPDQLLDRDRRRGPADPGGGDADRHPVQAAGVGGELAVGGDPPRAVEPRRDDLAPAGVAGEQHVAPISPASTWRWYCRSSHDRRNVAGSPVSPHVPSPPMRASAGSPWAATCAIRSPTRWPRTWRSAGFAVIRCGAVAGRRHPLARGGRAGGPAGGPGCRRGRGRLLLDGDRGQHRRQQGPRHPGRRSASDAETARAARRWNDANVLALSLAGATPDAARASSTPSWRPLGSTPRRPANLERVAAMERRYAATRARGGPGPDPVLRRPPGHPRRRPSACVG